MYPVVAELDSAIALLEQDPESHLDLNKLVVVEESPDYVGELVFQSIDPQDFYRQYGDWLSRHLILSQPFTLRSFVEQLESDGLTVLFGSSCQPILDAYERWEQPLRIDGFTLPNDGELYDFQSWSLNRALERDTYFWGWCPGSGKTCVGATAGAQELFNRDRIDLVLAVTLTPLKTNLGKYFEQNTSLRVVVNDGVATKRRKIYAEAALGDHSGSCTHSMTVAKGTQVFVINYDKTWADFDSLKSLVAQRRTLFILDEVQAVLTDGQKNRCRKALDQLLKAAAAGGHTPIVWPMSATVVNSSPFRYRDVFSLGNGVNPLGHKVDFEDRYVRTKKTYKIPTKTGKFFRSTLYTWDFGKLHEVRHRVADRAHNVRKSDAGIRENFRGMQNVLVPIQMSENDRRLYELVKERAWNAAENNENLGPFYRILRYICNTPEALAHTAEEIGQNLLRDHRDLVSSASCAKLEMLAGQLETIRDAGDKVVVFCQWTRLGVLLLEPVLSRRGIKVALHYGVGQSDQESQAAQRQFKEDPDTTVFLSSDAGSFGLNLQCARSVINYDIPYSYDVLTQRNNRIDRVDSYLDGLTSYVYLTEDTIEERIWKVLNQRKNLAAATLGTTEVLGYGDENDQSTLSYLIFGE